MHGNLLAFSNETYSRALFCDLVRHFWLEVMTVLFEEHSSLCSELYSTSEAIDKSQHYVVSKPICNVNPLLDLTLQSARDLNTPLPA
jgi:hypothetical protein